MKNLSKLLKASLLASGAIFAVSSVASAQSAGQTTVGTEVSAPVYEFTVQPGDSQQDIIKIKNVGKNTQTYYPVVLDFKSNDKDGTPIFLKPGEKNGAYSLSDWIKVATDPITLEANQSQALNFYVAVPANAEPGGHYGGILFSTQPPTSTGSSIAINSEVGSLVLVRVAGNSKEAASIKDFSTDKTSYQEANVKFNLNITNTGNVHVQPKGTITIKNILGGTIAALDVNQIEANVLAGSNRIFNINWKDPGFKLGYYTATAVLNYGDPSQTMTSQTSFWIIPWTTLLVALAMFIALLVILVFAVKRYNAWIIAKATKTQSPQ